MDNNSDNNKLLSIKVVSAAREVMRVPAPAPSNSPTGPFLMDVFGDG